MKSKTLKAALLALILTAAMVLPVSASTIGGGTVDATALNLRSEASTDSVSKALIPSQAFMLVEEKLDDWYKVMYNGQEGYVSSEFVNFSDTLSGSYGCKGIMIGDYVRMRSAPSTTGTVLGYYNAGAQFTITGVSGNWVKVCTEAGLEGYIHSDYICCLSSGSQLPVGSSVSGSGSDIVETAKQYLGTGYAWGGMSTSGFDCSGFVNYVYKLYGYSMYRVAQDIYSNNGTSVAKEDLQQGDLVFFGYSGSSITHVGMYIGDGQFIHSSSSAGKVVITDLSENYYTRMYVGAKRILA